MEKEFGITFQSLIPEKEVNFAQEGGGFSCFAFFPTVVFARIVNNSDDVCKIAS